MCLCMHMCVMTLTPKKMSSSHKSLNLYFTCVLLLLLVLVLGFRFGATGVDLELSAKQRMTLNSRSSCFCLLNEYWDYGSLHSLLGVIFFLLLLFACFIGTGDIKLSYPPLQSPKGLWNKTSDCLQVVCLWEGGLHFVLRSSSFF